jgi:phospholipase/carboxylesterase
VIRGGYGPDVAFLEQALSAVFARFAVGPLAVSGFSDGASYALSIGLANGDLFGHVLAWSPGFMAPPDLAGRPRVFVSHGTDDRVLPIDRCSRRLVPVLRADGYDVRYEEFEGGHVVPPDVLAASLDWFGARPR